MPSRPRRTVRKPGVPEVASGYTPARNSPKWPVSCGRLAGGAR